LCVDIGLLSSVVRPVSHISETRQARPIVAMEHYIEVFTIDSVTTFGSSPRYLPWEDIMVSNFKNMCTYKYGLLLDLASDHSSCRLSTSSYCRQLS